MCTFFNYLIQYDNILLLKKNFMITKDSLKAYTYTCICICISSSFRSIDSQPNLNNTECT